VLVVIMDGVGCGRQDEGDAVWLARTPTLDWLSTHAVTTKLAAHGTAVGLPSDADMGNSEVGHNAMGAGRVFDQGAKRVNQAIASGDLFAGEEWKRVTSRARASGEPVHFIGLLSDGNVHSHIDHLFALIARCHQEDVRRVRVHILLDGRDVPETSVLQFVTPLEKVLTEINANRSRDYAIASGGGRMHMTMDRYGADWAMVERGFQHHVLGEGRLFESATVAIEILRAENPGVSDQFFPGFVIAGQDGKPCGPIRDGAGVIFFNFRGDRAIEICRAFEDDAFSEFAREKPDVAFAGMMQYDGDLLIPKHYLVSPPAIDRTLGEYLARNRVPQLACSETQKYGHVTYFWNGNRGGMFDPKLESYVEIPSDRVPFEQRPWMKAAEITDTVVGRLQKSDIRHARINFANGDMVGHTGNLEASVLAVQIVDLCLARLLPVIEKMRGALIVTADHGNADDMFERDDKTGSPKRDHTGRICSKTSHSLNPVPIHIHVPGKRLSLANLTAPGLPNIAATILHLLGYERPEGYEPSLLR